MRTCVCSVFSVDYNDELDLLVSGSADFTVKVWALSAGACLNTLTGHTEWVTKVRPLDLVKAVSDASVFIQQMFTFNEMMIVFLKVILQKSEVESVVHSPGDYILLSADKYEIKVGVVSVADLCEFLPLKGAEDEANAVLFSAGLAFRQGD